MNHITHQQLEQLIGDHGAALVLYARQWCNDPDDAVQEACIELVRMATAPDDPVAWLFTTAKRRAMNQSRGENRRRNRNKLAGSRAESAQNSAHSAQFWFAAELEKREEAQQLQGQLELLEPLEREIVVAHVWGELTFSQIAKLVEISSSTAHRHYQNGLAKLKLALDERALDGQANRQPVKTQNSKSKQTAETSPTEFPTQFSRAHL